MRRPPIRILDTSGSPESIGGAHGRAFAEEIRVYTRQRIAVVAAGDWSGGSVDEADIRDLAESMLPAHQAFDESLYAEMCAMAEAAGISAAEAVVVGGFTDFVDTVRAVIGGDHPVSVVEDDCTAVIVPAARAAGAGFLAQTWDMHDTATDHVVLHRGRPSDAPAFNVFTTTGCLGQIGMNLDGVCVGINNLTGSDGRRGVTWPAVVRKMLTRSSTDEALDVLLDADIAGAHSYLLYDRDDAGYVVEAMPSARPVIRLADEPLVHTNHTFLDEASAHEAARPGVSNGSSLARRAKAIELLADGPVDAQRLFEMTREPTVICQRPVEPLHLETSGAAVMRPATGDFWACWGPTVDNDYARIAMPIRVPDVVPVPPSVPVMVGESGVRYHRLDEIWADMAVALEQQAFPNVDPDHLLDQDDVVAMAHDFPEGCFVGVDEFDVPIALGFGIRTYFDFEVPQHSYTELIERNGGGSGHVADGDWYYGTTIAVRPDHRRRGIGAELYGLRKQAVRDLGLRGIVAGGVIPGYAEHRHDMSAAEYIDGVVAGDFYDRTLSFQLQNGFEARGPLVGYIENPLVDDNAALIVWHNPEIRSPQGDEAVAAGSAADG